MAFFRVIRDLVGVDLMALVGSTVDQNPNEDELCCGLLSQETASQATDGLQSLLSGY